MHKKWTSITNKLASPLLLILLILLWQAAVDLRWIPRYLLPSPTDVIAAFFSDFFNLMIQAGFTLQETFLGMLIGVCLAFLTAVAMDRFEFFYHALYPILVITQTIPTIAIAPLLLIWMGFGIAPKVVLVVIVCYFPISVSLLDGFRSVDPDTVRLMKTMGSSRLQIFRYVKFPASLSRFFAGLRISTTYAMVSAVVAEWLGGTNGLGVYMTRVRKAYAYNNMFAVILLTSIISLLLMKAVDLLQKFCMPWEKSEKQSSKTN